MRWRKLVQRSARGPDMPTSTTSTTSTPAPPLEHWAQVVLDSACANVRTEGLEAVLDSTFPSPVCDHDTVCPLCLKRTPRLYTLHPDTDSYGSRRTPQVGCKQCAAESYIKTCALCGTSGIVRRDSLHDHVYSHALNLGSIIDNQMYPWAPRNGELWASIPRVATGGLSVEFFTKKYICSACAVHNVKTPGVDAVTDVRGSFNATVLPGSAIDGYFNISPRVRVWEFMLVSGMYITCPTCRRVHDFCTNPVSGQSEAQCPDCRSTVIDRNRLLLDENEQGLVHSYSYRPPLVFYTSKREYKRDAPRHFFYGAEVELSLPQDDDEDYDGHIDTSVIPRAFSGQYGVFCKEDGSVARGAEIVTHPMTLGYWHKNTAFFKSLDRLRVEFDASGEENGVHVHISRAPFKGTDNEVKFRTFVHALMDRFPIAYSELVGRAPNSYCQKLPSLNEFRDKRDSVSRHTDRYQAVNFQNPGTIEVRSFRGTTYKDSLLSYLEFCDASVAFALSTEQDFLEDNPILTPFYKFLKRAPGRYSNLIHRIQRDSIGGRASCVL